jgi:hypothetical protein
MTLWLDGCPVRIGILSALASAAMFAQAPPPRVEFEVASIRPSDPILSPADAAKIGVHIDGARVNLTKLSLNDCLAAAFKVKLQQISGPEWMASERFDINAKLPAGSNTDQIPLMVQALLADRFGMNSPADEGFFGICPGGGKDRPEDEGVAA